MIRSRSNSRARTIRRLRNSRGRRNADLLLLEGPHLTSAAVEAGLSLRHLLVTPDFLARHGALVDRIERESGARATPIDPDRLRERADADAPQGIAAIAAPPRGWKTARSAVPLKSGLHLYADGIQDPGNFGAMARSAEAVGAASLLLSPGAVRPSHPRALRASAGSLLRMRLWTDVSVDELSPDGRCLALTARSGEPDSRPAAALFSGDADPPDLFRSTDSIILAVGSESGGLSPALLARADVFLSIHVAPAVESLNAAVAASLALFELRRALARVSE